MAKPPDTMRNTALPLLWCCLLVRTLIVGGVRGNDVTCRMNNVEQQSRECMENFDTQLDALHVTNHKFFTGVDTEIIRSICSSFQDSLICLRNVREQCPATTGAFVDRMVEPFVSLHELCLLPEFYEHYAMSQACFHRVRTQSEVCWTHFRSSTADLVSEISPSVSSRPNDRRRQVALSQFCSRLRHLQTCVKAAVHKACKKLAAGLVDVLVRAAVDLSPHCGVNESFTGHVTTTSAAVDDHQGGAYGNHDDNDVRYTSGVAATSSSCGTRLWCLVWAAISVVYVAAFACRRHSCCNSGCLVTSHHS